MKKRLKYNYPIKICYNKWIDRFTTAFEYLDESEYYNETPGFDNCSDFEDIKSLVQDAVKTLKLLEKHMDIKKDRQLRILAGKIVSFNIFAGRIDIRKIDMLWLINFIDWDCRLLFRYAEDWVCSEEYAGIDMDTLLKLAHKYDKKIKGCRNSNSVYGLLMAVYHCRSDMAERFIIDNKIKVTDGLLEGNDGMVDDMIDYFKEENSYDITTGKIF